MSSETTGSPESGTTRQSSTRRAFLARRALRLDPFQEEAFELLEEGKSVLVAAPTGSGKTLIAEYAVARALAGGGRAIYTTPLKALSNQKYADFVAEYGPTRVGLLTGDVSRHGEAEIVVMTTEVLRNMIYAGSARLDDLRCVVLDEVHYLEDRYRGSVWEEIILSAPPSVVLVCLSATVSNAEELAGWIEHVRGSTAHVIEEHRPIDLHHLYVVGIRATHRLEILPTFVDGVPNPEAVTLDARSRPRHQPGIVAPRVGRTSPRSPLFRPRRAEVVERFAADDLLPAIYFVFSRAGCDDAVRQCLEAGLRLTTPEERRVIRDVADEHVEALSDSDLRVLGYSAFVTGLEAGFAAHHAGLVPPFREAVEELFGRAIVKVVFATETLALGINMPARSVVIESLTKFSGSGHEDLTAGNYTQLTGRAGRRGIDEVGHAAVLWSPYHSFAEVSTLAAARSRALRSSFHPTYNMAVNLVRRYAPDEAYRLVRSSFAQFLSDAPLGRQLDAVLEVLADREYLSGWRLTSSGERLAGIYHDCDLLIAEAVGGGLLGGLDAPSLAALVSLFTFESRRVNPPGDLPNTRLARRADELDNLARDLRVEERARRIPRTRQLDTGFARLAYEWARGAELCHLLTPVGGRRWRRAAPAVSGGDFVRNVKQLVDLLRQLALTEADSRLGTIAGRAVDQLQRGIVAASTPGEPEGD
ncbi:MAG TPA: DEAD/DEAH box helicase [Acidimicrobiales bacterium]|nr:DEAD/DEAH box helicase [Acidimicrobiales bacterium]